MIQPSLFMGERVRLVSPNVEGEAAIISGWTHNLDYSKRFRSGMARPMAVFEVKQFLTDQLKRSDESRNVFTFSIQRKSNDQLLGTAWLDPIEWSNRNARIAIYLGNPEAVRDDWLEGVKLIVQYAFQELGLHRLTTQVFEDEGDVLEVFLEAGFVPEVRQREAAFHQGARVDVVWFGILDPDWRLKERIGT